MKDYKKTKAELLDELAELRQEIARLKAVETECIELKQQIATSVPMSAEESMVKRAVELETVTQVSVAASTILETEKLLQEVVDLTKASFNLYHAHIYLLDDTGDVLKLAAGAGDAGRQMVAEGWNIPFVQEQSLVARAARTRQGVIVNDVREAPDWLPNPLLPDTRSELAVAMIVRDRVVGVLDVQADKVDYFTDEDIRIQSALAAQVAVAIENARLFEQERKIAEELEEHVQHLNELNEFNRELNQATNENEIFQVTARRMPQIIQADRASIALLTPMGNNFDVLALEGEAGVIPVGAQVPVEGTILGKTVRENNVIITPDIRNSDFLEHRRLAEQGLRSTINVPLTVGGRVIGVLNVGSKKIDAYNISDQSLMLQAVSLLSSALENLRLLKQTQERADELEETTTLYRTLFEKIADPIFVFDGETNHFLDWNQSALKRYGYSPEELRAMMPYQLHPPEELEIVKRNMEDTEDIAPQRYTHITKEGERFQVEILSTPLEYQGREAWMNIVRDITEQKRAEAERERLLAEVEAAYRQYVRKEWEQFLNEQHQGRWLIEHQQFGVQSKSTSEALGPIQEEVASEGKMKVVAGDGDNGHQTEATIVAPISLRGQVIGTLGLQDVDPNRQWTAEEVGLVETITEQLALTIENLRLFDDSQNRVTREQLTRKITEKMRASPDADSIIRTGLTELANALGVHRTYVKLVSMPVEDKETDGIL